jgi:exopolysaccharide biosynthesis polyprenyl glycosylphosphotransferase
MNKADTEVVSSVESEVRPRRFGTGLRPVGVQDAPPSPSVSPPLPPAGDLRPRLDERRKRLAETQRRAIAQDTAGLGRDRRGFHMRRRLAIADCVAVFSAAVLLVAIDSIVSFEAAPHRPGLFIPVAMITWLGLAGLSGMYHRDEKRLESSLADEVGSVVQITAVWTWIMFIFETLITREYVFVAPGVGLWLLSVPTILAARVVVRHAARRSSWFQQSAMVVGRPEDTDRVAQLLARHREYGVRVVGRLAMGPVNGADHLESVIGFAEDANVDRVIFAGNYEGLDERTGALRVLSDEGIKVDIVQSDSEVFRSDAALHFVEGLPMLTLPTTKRARSAVAVKRLIDIAGSALGLIALSPFFAYWALRIKLDSPGPVFFEQPRIGENGEPFALMKFRTMSNDADYRKHEVEELNLRTDGMFKIADDPRITRYGRRLRRHSIDELPQLINVLRGEMSLVGPRPLIERESVLVDDHYLARFDVRPGITGPWQVLGRSEIPFEDMLKLDYRYVTNWSLGEDLKLLLRTLSAIAHGHGAY